MGLTHVTTRLSALIGSEAALEGEFQVDTGAIDCMAPAARLDRAGIRPEGKAVYELADGSVVEYAYGYAKVSFMGSETVTQVIFGPDDCEPLLGAVALENVGIAVDPATRTLRRLAAKPLK